MRLTVLALVVLLPSSTLATDDHTFNEVEKLLGLPNRHQTKTCGGGTDRYGQKVRKWKCVNWLYFNVDGNGTALVLNFDPETRRLVNAALLARGGGTTDAREEIHARLHAARSAETRVPTPSEMGIAQGAAGSVLLAKGAESGAPEDKDRYVFRFRNYSVSVYAPPATGACEVKVYADPVKTNAKGEAVQTLYRRVRDEMTERFGAGFRHTELLAPDDKPEDYMAALMTRGREYGSEWHIDDEGVRLPDDLLWVTVKPRAVNAGEGFVVVTFNFHNRYMCDE